MYSMETSRTFGAPETSGNLENSRNFREIQEFQKNQGTSKTTWGTSEILATSSESSVGKFKRELYAHNVAHSCVDVSTDMEHVDLVALVSNDP